MKFFSSIRVQLIFLALGAILGVTAQSVTTWLSQKKVLTDVNSALSAKDLVADLLPPPLYLIEARLTLSRAQEGLVPPADALKQLEALKKESEARQLFWKNSAIDNELKKTLESMHSESMAAFWGAVNSSVFPKLRAGESLDKETLDRIDYHYNKHRKVVDATVAQTSTWEQQMAEQQKLAFKQAEIVSLASALVVLVLMSLGTAIITRLVWKQVGGEPHKLVEIASKIADGDLRQGITTKHQGSLAYALEQMRVFLVQAITQTSQTSSQVSCATSEIAEGIGDLSARIERDASTLEQTRSATDQSAQSAQEAKKELNFADERATQAAIYVERTVDLTGQSAQALNAATQQVSAIEEVVLKVKSLAQQVNMLAINAAIEAARAGEQGKGFAVVAQEVRKLSQNTAAEANSIEQLADTIQESLTDALEKSFQVKDSMLELAPAVAQVKTSLQKVSISANETFLAMTENAKAIADLDSSAQQNAALVEQSMAATESMAQQASSLDSLVQIFKV